MAQSKRSPRHGIKLRINTLKGWLKDHVVVKVVKDPNVYNPKVPYFSKIS